MAHTEGQSTQPAGAAKAAEQQYSSCAHCQAGRQSGLGVEGLWGAGRRPRAARDMQLSCLGGQAGRASVCRWVLGEGPQAEQQETRSRPAAAHASAGASAAAAAAAAAAPLPAAKAAGLPPALLSA